MTPSKEPISPMPGAEENRCDCGKLLVRVTAKGYEVKCSRCKRITLLPYQCKEHRTPDSH